MLAKDVMYGVLGLAAMAMWTLAFAAVAYGMVLVRSLWL